MEIAKQIEELDKQWKALHKDIVERCIDGTDNFEWSKKYQNYRSKSSIFCNQ